MDVRTPESNAHLEYGKGQREGKFLVNIAEEQMASVRTEVGNDVSGNPRAPTEEFAAGVPCCSQRELKVAEMNQYRTLEVIARLGILVY